MDLIKGAFQIIMGLISRGVLDDSDSEEYSELHHLKSGLEGLSSENLPFSKN